MAKVESKITLTGVLHSWECFGKKRLFSEITLPYAEAVKFIMPFTFNALTGKGEQRELNESNVKKLYGEIKNGTYTPAPISVGLRPGKQQKSLVAEDGKFTIIVSEKDPLAQTNGSHRFAALDRILKELTQKLTEATEQADKDLIQKEIAEINRLPITATILFDGNPQLDFINLQAGKAIDAAHMLSLKVLRSDDPAMKYAFEIARALHTSEAGPFKDQIRFDSRGVLPLPISTLCSKGSSDIGTSLVGLAKIALSREDVDEKQIAALVNEVYKTLTENCIDVLEYGKVLTPISKSGTKGSSTMLIGVAVCFIFRHLTGNSKKADDMTRLVTSVRETLDQKTNGNLSGPAKRQLLGEFAKLYLGDMEVPKHAGIPTALCRMLSCSTFAVAALPKEPKVKKTPTVKGGKKGPKKNTETAPETTVTPAAEAAKGKKTEPVVEKPAVPVEQPKPAAKPKAKKSEPTPEAAKSTTVEEDEVAPWEVEIAG